MRTPYRMVLSDGRKVVVSSPSAAEAIETARRDYRGCTVASCYSGLTEEDCAQLRRMDGTSQAMPGILQHDILPHDPIPYSVRFDPPRRRSKDLTQSMFNESEIRIESENAKRKAQVNII